MDATAKAIEVLKASLNELNSGLEGKTATLKKAKEDAYKAAEQTYKNAKAEADRIFKDGMKQFEKEEREVESLVKALEALGVKSVKSTAKTKVAKPKGERIPFPKTLEEAKTDKEKIGVVLTKLGEGTIDEIESALNKAGVEITKKSIQQNTFLLKKDGQIGTAGKRGKAFIFKIA